jgi:hypothetical protein
MAEQAFMLGELLALMQPSLEHVRGLYLNTEAAARDEKTPATGLGGGFVSLDLEVPVADEAEPEVDAARAFARALNSDWRKRLRDLPGNPNVTRFLRLPKEILEILVEEVIAGSARGEVEDRLVERLREAENRAGTTRARLVDQQALVARNVIAEYVDALGFDEMPENTRPESSRIPKHRLFAAPPAFAGLPAISERPLNFPAIRICDWLDAFAATAIGNAGRGEGREINIEQSRRLEAILKGIETGGEEEAR